MNEETLVVDELGRQATVLRTTPAVDDVSRVGDAQRGDAVEFRTTDGLRVVARDDGTFQAEATGTRFRPAP